MILKCQRFQAFFPPIIKPSRRSWTVNVWNKFRISKIRSFVNISGLTAFTALRKFSNAPKNPSCETARYATNIGAIAGKIQA